MTDIPIEDSMTHYELELFFYDRVESFGIECIRAEPYCGKEVDYYLPKLGLYVEIADVAYGSHFQALMTAYRNKPVMVLIGEEAVKSFLLLLHVMVANGVNFALHNKIEGSNETSIKALKEHHKL